MIKFIKRLCGCKPEPQPDVLLVTINGGIKAATSRMLGSRRVVEGHCDDLLILQGDGTVHGSMLYTKWEKL